ncbi:hypothetical protein BDZ97DRAFT_264733 [Flammula alnicola]|nr:hypothetical protein BDZ97DRAFT_264733 [Flammula alnicola]
MSSFASLMALSATHTRESQQAVDIALQERRRKEALQRKQQEEREAKEREQEKKLRLRRLEEEKRQQERLRRLEEERKAKELALQRREDEQRDLLRYGPKKVAKMAGSSNGGSSKWPSSSSDAREAVRKRRVPDDADQDSPGIVLTREELRERKQQAEMRKQFATSKRASHSNKGYGKAGRRLPGGAVDIVTNQGKPEDESVGAGRSVKDRLTSKPNTLVLLNVKKRDKRTEDEIQMEVRASKKVLDGTEALQFNDWFGDSKKKEAPKRSPAPVFSSSPPSRPDTPASRTTNGHTTVSTSVSASSSHKSEIHAPKSMFTKPLPAPAHKPTTGTSRGSSSDLNTASQSKFPKINKTSAASASSQRPSSSTANAQNRSKRPRSLSLSESPPPHRKRSRNQDQMDISSEIWKLFGKDRGMYISRDVLSDDEDMEADATVLEREEKMSARIAKREEMLAAEEERRHEEEKRQRKKEKERALTRGR